MIDTPFFAFTLYSAKLFLDLSIIDHRRFCKRFLKIFFLIFQSLPLIIADSAANLVQEVHGHGAGGVAQMVENGGGGKLGNTGKVLVLQIISGVQAAAGEDGVLDAGGQEVLKTHFQIEVVQFLQQTIFCVIGEVMQMVPVDLADGAAGLLHERPANVRFLCGAVLPLQSLRDGGMMVLLQLPQVGRSRPLDRAGVGHIKDIFQPGPATAVLLNQGDALGTGLYPPPHGFIPQLHAGAGGSVRALGIDQELVVKRVFIKPLSRGNVRFWPFISPLNAIIC